MDIKIEWVRMIKISNRAFKVGHLNKWMIPTPNPSKHLEKVLTPLIYIIYI